VIAFVLAQHFWPACEAALLFLLGALLAWPLLKTAPGLLSWFPRLVLGLVRKLIGARPGIGRMTVVIWGFNGTAMFLYMAAGFRPWLPEAVAVLTGFNIAAVMLWTAGGGEILEEPAAGDGWVPGKALAGLCGLTVLLLELPCFWYAVGMGIRLGREVASGSVPYGQGLCIRAQAYAVVILPALLVSALCEAVAIRGMQAER